MLHISYIQIKFVRKMQPSVKISNFVLIIILTLSKIKILYSFILSSDKVRKESKTTEILNISHKITYSPSISVWEMTIRKFETIPNWTVLTLTRSPLQIFKCGLILNSEVNCEDTICREDVGNIEKSLIKTKHFYLRHIKA